MLSGLTRYYWLYRHITILNPGRLPLRAGMKKGGSSGAYAIFDRASLPAGNGGILMISMPRLTLGAGAKVPTGLALKILQ